MTRSLVIVALIAASGMALRLGAAPPALTRLFDAATDAWERGEYSAALTGFIQIVTAPGGDAFLEPIALTTGQLFETRELTRDGRAPRFSPDNRLIAYDTGLETSRRTRIVKNDSPLTPVVELPGVSATFSSTLNQVAYLRIPDNDEIRRASAALEQASLTAQNRGQLTQALTWLIAKHAAIVTRDLTNGREMELPAPDLVKTGLVFSADGRQLYFLGAKESEPERTDVYVISENAPKPAIAAEAGGLKSAPIVDPAGKVLIYLIPSQNPLRTPVPPGGAGAERAGGGGGTGRDGANAAPPQFAIVDVATRKVDLVVGSAPSLSGDGRTLAYVMHTGAEYSLMVGATAGTRMAVKRTAQRLDAPALSADGSRLAFQMMPRDDWEIFVADRDGTHERQVTHEIQHDLLTRFIGPDRLLAVIGEPRHRRSYLYDLGSDPGPTLSRQRLFHNNTVRTIAREYQWAVSPDGTKILIGAERDGNSVSPERGVYIVDLQKTITKIELVSRLRTQLKAAMALKGLLPWERATTIVGEPHATRIT